MTDNNENKEIELENIAIDNKKQFEIEYATITQLNNEASIRAETDWMIYDHSEKTKANITYVDAQDELKQDKGDNSLTTASKIVVGAINEIKNTKTDYIYVDRQTSTKQNITDNNLTTTDKTVVGAINELVTNKVDKAFVIQGFYWKPCPITGAKTRNVKVVDGLEVGETYRIGFTWSSLKNASYTYKEFTYMTYNIIDIERYWHSGIAGLLPNVLALANDVSSGFKIYTQSGVQTSDGFIISVDIKTNLEV